MKLTPQRWRWKNHSHSADRKPTESLPAGRIHLRPQENSRLSFYREVAVLLCCFFLSYLKRQNSGKMFTDWIKIHFFDAILPKWQYWVPHKKVALRNFEHAVGWRLFQQRDPMEMMGFYHSRWFSYSNIIFHWMELTSPLHYPLPQHNWVTV